MGGYLPIQNKKTLNYFEDTENLSCLRMKDEFNFRRSFAIIIGNLISIK